MTARDSGISLRLTGVGVSMIAAVALITYFPALQLGFHLDDWRYLEYVGRLGPLQFIVRSFNPLEPSFLYTYRPLQGVLLGLEYPLFGKDPVGYHWAQLVLHVANCLLVYSMFRAITQNWHVAMLSGLVYAGLPIFGQTIFLPTNQDALATLFYLTAVRLWLGYLTTTRGIWSSILTHVALVLGLLTKEYTVTLPLTLLMVDLLFVRNTVQIATLIRRYMWIAVILLLYLVFELNIQSKTALGSIYGVGLGLHIFTNAARYFPTLIFPWSVDIPYIGLLALAVVMLSFLYAVRTRSALLAFLAVWSILNTLPVLGFQFKFSLRFLYFSAIGSAVFLALIVNASNRVLARWRFSTVLASGLAVLLLLFNANAIASAAQEYAQAAFEERWLFRDVSQQHRTFPNDTYLYFLGTEDFFGSQEIYFPHLSGMFYWRYGDRVTVEGWNQYSSPQLEEHANPLIYHVNSQSGKPIEIAVDKKVMRRVTPQEPAVFGGTIRLVDYQITSASVKPGTEIILLLYWQAVQPIDKDYTVFVHLVDSDGTVVTGWDSQPAMGHAATSGWKPGHLVTDWIVLSIPSKIAVGTEPHLEVGLYYLPTLERLQVVDEQGIGMGDHTTLSPFGVR